MERLLAQAAAELSIRSEVESTLTSILQDVEHAHALEQSLQTHNKLHQCRERLDALKVRYEDREAAWDEDRREKERLGMLLLEQIVKLSAREAESAKSKQEMEMRLHQLEDEKRRAGEICAAQQQEQQQKNNEQNLNVVADGVKKKEDEEGMITQDEGDSQPAAVMNEQEEEDKQILESSDANVRSDPGEKQIIISDTETHDATEAKVDEGSQTPLASNSKSLLVEGSQTPTISKSTNEGKGVVKDVDGESKEDQSCNRQSFVRQQTPPISNSTRKSKGVVKDVDGESKEEDQSKFVPHKLDETTLMKIFEYSDPLDVMNFAQTNKALMSKVNIMFGMSSEVETSDVNQQHQQQTGSGEDAAASSVQEKIEQPTPQPTATDSDSAAATTGQAVSSAASTAAEGAAVAIGTTKNGGPWTCPACTFENQNSLHLACEVCGTAKELMTQPSGEKSESIAEATNAATQSTTTAKSSPKLFGMPGPSHKRQGSGTSVATTGSAGSVNPFSQVSSWFGSATSTATADTSSTTSAPTTAGNATSTNTATSAPASTDTGEIKLNAAMANSMASKLTPAELSIILRMREKLQRCEADANKFRLEKEDAVANLSSVEAVKEFLVTRVRDTERMVQSQKEDMGKAQKKYLEDQEVIVFLDEKVKEMEKSVEEMKSKEATTKQESVDIVSKNEKKSRVLSDMLRFEREQMAANEKEWKKEKKVLVKEVKSCRGRIVALEAEAEGCRRQNEQLKQGLMSLQSSGSMSPGVKKSLKSFGR